MKLALVGLFLLMLCDCLLVSEARKLLYGFLEVKRNHSGARKIHKSQSVKNRIFLSYVRDHVTEAKHLKLYKRFRFIYFLELGSIIPQYIAVAWMWNEGRITEFLILICAAIKIVLLVYFRIHLNSNRQPKYSKYGK